MHMPEDFVPDFTRCLTTGQICNQHSKIRQIANLSYISLFNRLNVWNIRTQELVFSLGTQKHRITCFDVQEDLALLGYENGSIEIIKNYGSTEERASKILRLHSKRVTCLQRIGDTAMSSSLDGSLCTYDLAVEETGIRFEGNSASIDNFSADQSRILAACADKTIKIWKPSSPQLLDALAFDEYIFAAVFKGKEALVVFRNGDSSLVDLETREKKPFERFKSQRNILLKDGRVIVQCQKKTIVYGITSKSGLGLAPLERISTSQDYVSLDYDRHLIFLSKKNRVQYGDETIDFGFHEEEILDIRIDSNRIFSLSKDRICCWIRVQDSPLGEAEDHEALSEEEQYACNRLDFHGSVAVKHATCLELFNDFAIVGGSGGIQVFDKEFFELKDEMALGSVLSIAAFESTLAVSIGSVVHFYDPAFSETGTKSMPDTVTCFSFSKDGTLLVCSCLDSKVYVFDYPSMELRSCLYGHSLPVKCLSVSWDSKLLITAGADKLVKIWGLDFGECRKTLLGNTRSVEYMSNTLFMFCDKNIEYYDNAVKLRSFRAFSPSLVRFGTDYMVATSDKGLSLFTMNKYEFMAVEDSSDIEDVGIKNIASIRDYDAFLDHLQKIENNGGSAMPEFYAFIESSDMNELREYMYVLDHTFVRLILDTVEANISRNPIVNARILTQLLRSHRDVCLSTDGFYRIKDQLLERIRDLRDLYHVNEAILEVDMNRIDAEYPPGPL